MRFYEVTVLNISNASLCSSYQLPSIKEYFEGAYVYGIAFYSVGAVVLLLVLLLFADSLRHVLHNSSPRFKTYTAYVLAVYPVICLLNYLTILVPRAYLLSDALIQVTLTSSLYQLFCLFVTYCEGEATLAKNIGDTKLSLQTSPLCCCCCILPAVDVTKSTMRFLKIQVLQLPIVQGLIYLLYLVMWLESQELYERAYWYLQVIIIVSFLCGIWGLNMTTQLLTEGVDGKFLFRKKLTILQVVIPLTQLQAFIKKSLVQYGVLPCNPPLVPMFYGNLIFNTINMVEMLLLGFCAQKLYKRGLPEINDRSIQVGGIISTVFGSVAG
ncbi:organic solute transporter alpha-like protein [Euwallacea fornicatus]|uniref:organic solute transporter alpha-like protein n=1 Tax=Euwallacea fornicatus TaxID=995702 RepID=UPI00338DEEA3